MQEWAWNFEKKREVRKSQKNSSIESTSAEGLWGVCFVLEWSGEIARCFYFLFFSLFCPKVTQFFSPPFFFLFLFPSSQHVSGLIWFRPTTSVELLNKNTPKSCKYYTPEQIITNLISSNPRSAHTVKELKFKLMVKNQDNHIQITSLGGSYNEVKMWNSKKIFKLKR